VALGAEFSWFGWLVLGAALGAARPVPGVGASYKCVLCFVSAAKVIENRVFQGFFSNIEARV
jgi:hypothetical protein